MLKHRNSDFGIKKVKTKSSGYGLRVRQSTGAVSAMGASPSLLNGTGDSNLISSGAGARGSDSFLSVPSRSDSQNSSANASYMTDATQIDEGPSELAGDERGRPKSQDASTEGSPNSKDKDMKGNVVVSVRVRPDAAGGDGSRTEGEWMVEGRRALISYNGREGGDYRYDNVFSPHDQNARVYDAAAKRLVRRVMEGYHGTVFAYGMTGTGKTFSMQGTANSPGVIPLAITDIFSYIRENPNREFLLRVSYLEIYNEKIFDLLSQSTPGVVEDQDIKLREDPKRGVYATPLKEEIVQSPNQLLRVIARGDLSRRTAGTQYNARSSRSHAVVQIVVESRERAPVQGSKAEDSLPGGVLVSTLSLIDLAGSEKAAENKERRTEGAHINKSLLTLGTVIARLSGDDEKDKEDASKATEKDKDKALKHLPYRDSKLTRLLQPALSGDSLVSILCTIQLSSVGTSAAAAGLHTGETLNTLKFASRAKNNIVSHAKKNESNPGVDAGSRALLDRYRLEIQELRAQLDDKSKAKDEIEKQDEVAKDIRVERELERQEKERHEEQMLEMQLARTALKERIGHLNRLILSSRSLGVNVDSGRFSSMSVPVNRQSRGSSTEFGRPVSTRSRQSSSSNHSRSRRESNAETMPNEAGRVSVGSITPGVMPAAPVSQLVTDENALEDDEDDDSGGPDGDGQASLAQQNRMLQADISDKNRYIATLEKRLLQARRTSRSRVSMTLASRSMPKEDGGSPGSEVDSLLREKDREIEELKAKLDDQTRMVTALRSVTRQRDSLENRKSIMSDDTARPVTAQPFTNGLASRKNSSRLSNRSLKLQRASSLLSNGHKSNPSTASRSSTGGMNLPKTPLSPMALLSPSGSDKSDEAPMSPRDARKRSQSIRRKSVDEMTMLLDQMIQDKVESGHVLRGKTGSLRIKRDTLIEKSLPDVSAGAENKVIKEEEELSSEM